MFRPLALLGSSLLVTAAAVWAGCQGPAKPVMGTGGSTSTVTTTTTPIGVGGGSTCVGPMPDGVCQLTMGEDCNCVDCQSTAFCNPGQCGDTTMCDHMADSCTCAICAEDFYCGDPTLGNCKDGGACDPYVEGCHCPDCWTYPACQASVAACAGGKPDGTCDRSKENCDCVDCQGTALCVLCNNSGTCTDNEPCDCADCALSKRCTDPALCVNDGTCAILTEGCLCDDCKTLPECIPWLDGGLDGGVDSGSDGGMDAGTDAALDSGLDAGLDAADASD